MFLSKVIILALIGAIQAKLINLSCKDIQAFVDGHNWRRLLLAQGKVAGQPAAKHMQMMLWDDELANKAANWASLNIYDHNPDKTLASGRFETGENIYRYQTTDQDYHFDLDTALAAWFDEYKDFPFKTLEPSDFESPVDVGHYTQMAWANTVLVGCAISNYKEGQWNTFLVVCDYGPQGNMLGEEPYEEGTANNALYCKRSKYVNCDLKYGSRCSTWGFWDYPNY
ncbi:venom allergen 5-like [Hyposmocoma kahamanoa]|uniref:venom allergen 5-like n=1 Tax=Hyposmocoma kahamanoa TaxID=1477025 RepID=UPI000E6D8850|nr:venom allergen 5-like [Hyposmocoma kahamanoa]